MLEIANRPSVMYRIQNTLILLIFLWLIFRTYKVNARPINKQSSDNVGETKRYFNETVSQAAEVPTEVQRAVCTVIAGDVKAQAEAVTTNLLKGVCGSNEMHNALNNLEIRLNKELDTIKNLISSLNSEGNCDSDETSSGNNISSQKSNQKPIVKLYPIPYENKLIHYNEETTIDNKYRSLSLPVNDSLVSPIREKEILDYNNTLHSEKDIKIFSYYWKIENFTDKIANGSAVTIESPIFSIKGKTLKVKASFQHLHRDFLFFQLEDASLHHTTRNSIILDTGGLFKEIQNDSFKYKMSVLDQNDQQSKDLVSQEFGNHDAGFLIPNSALLDSPFIKDDSLLIKICLHV